MTKNVSLQARVECSQIWSSCTELDLANQMPCFLAVSKQKPMMKTAVQTLEALSGHHCMLLTVV